MPHLQRRRRFTLIAAVAAFALNSLATPAMAQEASAPLVAIDPGHGGDDWGTNGIVSSKRLFEKELTLKVAKQAAENLKQAGYRTVMLRTDDTAVNKPSQDRTGDGKIDMADELQARVDRANDSGAAILLSMHFNGSADKTLKGPQVYYSAARPFAAENRKLAEKIMSGIATRLKEVERSVTPGGVLRDSVLGGSLFLLGPQGGLIARASSMPGVLIEGLFLTNAEDAAALADPETIQALAAAYADGAAAYLGPPPKPKAKRPIVQIGDAGAYLRPAPLLGTKPLATLDAGTVVDLAEPAKGDAVDGSADWWRVNVAGQAGYVFASLIDLPAGLPPPVPTPASPPPKAKPTVVATPIGKVTVRDDQDGKAARLRATPSTDSAIVVRARPGETLDLLDEADGEAVDGKIERWLKVRRGEIVGWVWAPLVDA